MAGEPLFKAGMMTTTTNPVFYTDGERELSLPTGTPIYVIETQWCTYQWRYWCDCGAGLKLWLDNYHLQ